MQSSLFAFHTRPLSSLFHRAFFHRALSFILSRLRPVFDRPPKKEDKDTMTDTPACPHAKRHTTPFAFVEVSSSGSPRSRFRKPPRPRLLHRLLLYSPTPAETSAQRRRRPPTTLTLTPSTLTQPRSSTGQAPDRIRPIPSRNRPVQNRPGSRQAAHRIRQNRTRTVPGCRLCVRRDQRPVSANFIEARPQINP